MNRSNGATICRARTDLRFTINVLTRLRVCTADGRVDLKWKGKPPAANSPYQAWFDVKNRATRDTRIIFGHWSAQGFVQRNGVVGLDSGCVWGGSLTAIDLDSDRPPVSVGLRRLSGSGRLIDRSPGNRHLRRLHDEDARRKLDVHRLRTAGRNGQHRPLSRVHLERSELVRQYSKRNTYRPDCVLARLQDSIALSTAQTQIDDEGIALPVLRIRRHPPRRRS